MKTCTANRAFTLPEVLIAVGILSILLLANLSAVSSSRLQMAKDHDRGIVLDFVGHYLELIKAMPFNEVSPCMPVNTLYDGVGSAPDIRIPTTANWFSLAAEDYQVFHPELTWISSRNPQMRVELTTHQQNGVDHTKHLLVEVKWESPNSLGPTQSVRMDMVRVKDL